MKTSFLPTAPAPAVVCSNRQMKRTPMMRRRTLSGSSARLAFLRCFEQVWTRGLDFGSEAPQIQACWTFDSKGRRTVVNSLAWIPFGYRGVGRPKRRWEGCFNEYVCDTLGETAGFCLCAAHSRDDWRVLLLEEAAGPECPESPMALPRLRVSQLFA